MAAGESVHGSAGAVDRRRVSRLAQASAILFLLPALYAWGRDEPAHFAGQSSYMRVGSAASLSDGEYLRSVAAEVRPDAPPASQPVETKPAAVATAAPARAPVKHDRYYCEFLAQAMTGNVTPEQAGRRERTNGAVMGAVGGAVLGALWGGSGGHSGRSSVLGAGAGLLAGVTMGSSSARRAAHNIRSRYDAAYTWCINQKDDAAP